MTLLIAAVAIIASIAVIGIAHSYGFVAQDGFQRYDL